MFAPDRPRRPQDHGLPRPHPGEERHVRAGRAHQARHVRLQPEVRHHAQARSAHQLLNQHRKRLREPFCSGVNPNASRRRGATRSAPRTARYTGHAYRSRSVEPAGHALRTRKEIEPPGDEVLRVAVERARLGRLHPHELSITHLKKHVAVRNLAPGEVDGGEHAIGVELVDVVQRRTSRQLRSEADATSVAVSALSDVRRRPQSLRRSLEGERGRRD